MNLTNINKTSLDGEIYPPGIIVYLILNMGFVLIGSLGNQKIVANIMN
jgi:hypothetical protein